MKCESGTSQKVLQSECDLMKINLIWQLHKPYNNNNTRLIEVYFIRLRVGSRFRLFKCEMFQRIVANFVTLFCVI